MMYRNYPKYKVAAAQIGSVFCNAPDYFDSAATLKKAVYAIEEASSNGAQFIVFPELFLPGYPYWSVDLKRGPEFAVIWREYLRHSPMVPGPETDILCKAAKSAGVFLAVGINERDPKEEGRMYNSVLFINKEGEIVGVHRKINITVHEQLFHTRADLSVSEPMDNVRAYDTELGRMTGLVCGEHYQPLLMQNAIVEGAQIHAALWPGYFDYPGAYSLKTIIPAMTQGFSIATQSWSVVASGYIPKEERPDNFYPNAVFDDTFGGSCVINPTGEIVAGPLYDCEGIVYADVDLGVIPLAKSVVNLTGIYDRRDILSLSRREEPYRKVQAIPGNTARAGLTSEAPAENRGHHISVDMVNERPMRISVSNPDEGAYRQKLEKPADGE